MGLFTKYREADGETIFTPFGCLLIILLVPLFLILGILSKPFSFLYSNNSGKGSTQNKDVAFDSLVRKRLRANENQYKRRFFNVHNISEEFFFNAKIDYQQVNIPKKMGGVRTLSIPNDELKELQKLLVPIFTKELRKFISKNANAYLYKRSIVTNAEPHLGCKVLIKLDIKDFFKSIKTDQLKPWIGLISYSDEIRHRLLELVHSHELGLPQGAPTSPVLSNLVLKKNNERTICGQKHTFKR